MADFYLIALLLVGVISANVIKQFIPKVPETFILILTGVVLSFVPLFRHFELEPEFFLMMIIAPLMFVDGQKQSFEKIRSKFSGIFLLSVFLAVVTAIVVGVTANWIEKQWTLPLAIALAAIITPTDAVAVKSLTSDSEMPSGVGEALELESLFNDATGLVLLDLALSVLSTGTFSIINGIVHFLFVAVGGILVGLIAGFALVALRFNLNTRGKNPEITTIPISLLTPFAVYLLAEHLGMSGILAVVATGIEHNWEANRLRLSSTSVQLTNNTIWNVITDVLNDFVFLILGLALPTIYADIVAMGWSGTLHLLLISVLVYVIMLVLRYVWAVREKNESIAEFFGKPSDEHHQFNSGLFAISGIHGTVTLAMALSLPNHIGGHNFPYRNELIIIAMFVILISMIVSAVVLNIKLPKKVVDYGEFDLNQVRNKMIDQTILKMRVSIDDRSIRDALTNQLQSQKTMEMDNRNNLSDNYYLLLSETKGVIDNYLHSPEVSQQYNKKTIDIYDSMMNRMLVEKRRVSWKHMLRHLFKEILWHARYRPKLNRDNYKVAYQQKIATDPKFAKKAKQIKQVRQELLDLNQAVVSLVDQYLDDILRSRLTQQRDDNNYIYIVQHNLNRFFDEINHEYRATTQPIDAKYYAEAFQYEYDFIQQGLANGSISQPIAGTLYTEINQAQLLQLQQLPVE
ncbi:cation:proton antiporter [Pediococcus claussenii]|uniref:Sodium/hydrogen exchanger family protein n=1 Tax=Pediococcus claussenii (strain ATCC BAA-344 / DSM 14800 / JCM 18046 / KCTC 3811 / LMG 21948 / P06) TaxID=701521 RepID=G8PAX2_PEDCP|nr:sodium:proton antiporter [Pediococcus claussenii]AEV95840.1 sodium/hydrogen exchanger family protein [Pediococcus claussenii ATCC BAA-344]ANZ69337.1 peptidase [Pediococcus claussenii]ANZ71157.1 peptidase [Pediococcus claussenii]KRN20446.1 hypothetical protein IV79_GL000501 [Pediococcus claussenii]